MKNNRPTVTTGDVFAPSSDLTRGYAVRERRDYPDGRTALVFDRVEGFAPGAVLVWDRAVGTSAGFLWHRLGTVGAALTRYHHGARATTAQRRALGAR